jgi:hypothetical protein
MISLNRAREIASWWQSPGTHGKRFSEFASVGEISDPQGLFDDIERESKDADEINRIRLQQLKIFIESWLDEE